VHDAPLFRVFLEMESMSSDAVPVRELGPQGIARKPLGQDLPTIFVGEGVGVVVAVNGEGTMSKLSLEEAESKMFIQVDRFNDNLFGATSSMTIKIKSSRVRIALFIKR
jgi:hypothetical protein